MERAIGVIAGEHLAAGIVENHQLVGPLQMFPRRPTVSDVFQGMPVERICDCVREHVRLTAGGQRASAIGLAFPGIIQEGVVGDSPNLQQLKGWDLQGVLSSLLSDVAPRVQVFNDADAMATGIAALRGDLDLITRLWFLGTGIGYGRYPRLNGIWEGGHSVVSLDPAEHFCGCGGIGHLEGILGHRAMRLRFLDMEPEEVFATAKEGDPRCEAFVKLWHRALAAASATSVHMDGPGKFYLSGPNSRFVQIELLNLYLKEMVQMSPLQGTVFEVAPNSDELAVVGAAVGASQNA